MQVLEVHHAFLSNYEVYSLIKQDVGEQEKMLKKFKAKHGDPKRQPRRDAPPKKGVPYFDFQTEFAKLVPENLRNLQVEALKYFRHPDQPCTSQRPKSIRRIMEELAKVQAEPDDVGSSSGETGGYALTKTEKLMLINLMPQKMIIDDLETRFNPENIELMLSIFSPDGVSSMLAAESGTDGDAQAEQLVETVQEEDEEIHKAEDGHEEMVEDNVDEIYEEEDDALAEEDIMPDEENDLIDEGMGDGGREEDVRDIDEVDGE